LCVILVVYNNLAAHLFNKERAFEDDSAIEYQSQGLCGKRITVFELAFVAYCNGYPFDIYTCCLNDSYRSFDYFRPDTLTSNDCYAMSHFFLRAFAIAASASGAMIL